jgi:hypothetical protein
MNTVNTPPRAADAPVPQAGMEQTAADQAAKQVSEQQPEQSSAVETTGVVADVVSGALDILISIFDD